MKQGIVSSLVFSLGLSLLLGCAAKKVGAPAKVDVPEKAAAENAVSGEKSSEIQEKKAAVPTAVPEVKFSPDSPTAVIRNYTEELKRIVEPEKRSGKGEEDSGQEDRIAEKVREFFDFPGLARMSLGYHWSRITPAQRKEFSKLFIGLVEESYIRRSRDIVGDYDLSYHDEEVKGKQAKVKVTVARSDANVDIVYELHKKRNNWMIYNIILDDVDLIRNYQTQFNSLIKKKSFNGLLDIMRKKLEEVDQEVSIP